jgi:hypothetical protein
MADRAKRGFADGTIRPIIVDQNNYIVNGHHRYDVARGTELARVDIIRVNASIEELIKHFSDTVSKAPTMKEQLKINLDLAIRLREAKRIDEGEERSIIRDAVVQNLVDTFGEQPGLFADNQEELIAKMYAELEAMAVEDVVDAEMEVGGQPIGNFASGRVLDVVSANEVIETALQHVNLADLEEAKSKKSELPKQNNPVAKHSRNMSGAGSHKSTKDYNRKDKKKDISSQLDEAPYVASRSTIIDQILTILKDKAYTDDNLLKHLAELIGKKVSQRNANNHKTNRNSNWQSEAVVTEKDPCWKGYKQIGMKKKGNKEVPNCVPTKK